MNRVQLICFHFRTVDASVFKPIVAINALSADDCPNLHLIAVTQSGVRLYFSTVSIFEPTVDAQALTTGEKIQQQPQSLYLLHVRLPPGYTANASIGKPKSIHSSFHSTGSVLMVSSAQQDQDYLWSLSAEPFPLRPYLAESASLLPLNGQVWAIAEVKDPSLDHALVTPIRTARSFKKIVLLTNQEAHIVVLIKPMGLLMQLLSACNGPHHEAVKSYFQEQSEPQTCASSLLLATAPIYNGTEIGMFATQSFLIYGGEPQRVNRNQLHNTTFNDPHLSNANVVMSTPIQQQRSPPMPFASMTRSAAIWQQSMLPYNSQQAPEINYSAKHTGLYLHIARLLRSIWKKKCILLPQTESSISHETCTEILDELYAIKSFLEALPLNNLTGE